MHATDVGVGHEGSMMKLLLTKVSFSLKMTPFKKAETGDAKEYWIHPNCEIILINCESTPIYWEFGQTITKPPPFNVYT